MPLSWWIGSLCQYGKAGDLLWVRETWLHADGSDGTPNAGAIIYSANYLEPEVPRTRWRPSIHMPRTASRLTLRITDVRVQRLQDISPDDCVAERSEEHTSELQSLMRISYAVFCLKKKKTKNN